MMKINGNEIRPGNVIEHDGGLWVAVKTNSVKPGKGGAYNQVELKNLIDGTKLNERFRSAETVERVQLELKDFSAHIDRDLLGKVALRDCGRYLGDVAHLPGQV